MTNLQQIESMLDSDVEALFVRAGAELAVRELGAAEPSRDEAEARGRNWFAANRATLQKRVCGSHTVKLYREQPSRWDRAFLVVALADCISGAVTGVTPMTAAVLAVKIGLDELCDGWRS